MATFTSVQAIERLDRQPQEKVSPPLGLLANDPGQRAGLYLGAMV